jgi:hypothetical protein
LGGSWFEASPGKKLKRPPISTKKLSVVVLAFHPSYVGGKSMRIIVQTSLGKKW